jgi:hypothetical protein
VISKKQIGEEKKRVSMCTLEEAGEAFVDDVLANVDINRAQHIVQHEQIGIAVHGTSKRNLNVPVVRTTHKSSQNK